MDCQGVSERLPWLLNGSLPPSERDAVRAHLTTCGRCAEELDETRQAGAVFGAHLAPAVVMDVAWDRPVTGVDRDLADAHLASCPECRDELDLARESRRLEAEEPSERRRPAMALILPAALAAGLFAGFFLGTRRTPAVPSPDPRVAELEAESARLRTLVGQLEAAARSVRPRINVPLFELLPALVRRGSEPDAVEVAIPAGASEVALLLSAVSPAGTPASLVVSDASGREVWKTDGLVAVPPGGYVVTVPVEMLPEGAFALRLQPRGGTGSDYRIRVRR